jgi:hypothetical protein
MRLKGKNLKKSLLEFEQKLKDKGYRKFIQNYKNENFAYWKSVNDENGKKLYTVGLLFYDWREHQGRFNIPETIGIQYECMTIGSDRVDMSVSKDIPIEEFESMCEHFYKSIKEYL